MTSKIDRNSIGQNIDFVISKSDADLKHAREMYIKSFYHNYRNIPITDLNPQFKTIFDVEEWFASSFDEEEALLRKNKVIFIQAISNNTVVGIASFELESSENKSMLLRNIAVSAEHHRAGIGRKLVFSILDVTPDVKIIYVIVNNLNQIAVNFYENLGFRESSYTYARYDSPKYASLEWHKKNK